MLRFAGFLLLFAFSSYAQVYDVIIRGGTVYDGTGAPGVVADVAVNGDRISRIGNLAKAKARIYEVDATGKAVSPGFINMLSWATESLIADGRGLSDLKQGVTLEVFGEGSSMGPLSPKMKRDRRRSQKRRRPVPWTTLSGYLQWLAHKGISVNVASFVGATTVRIHEIGHADRPPTAEELKRMQALVRREMQQGALGVGSSLIYAPAFYAKTDELVALCKAAAPYGGMYISHLRSEGNQFLEALDELITIAREAGVRAEVYHLKAAGKENWGKLDAAIGKIEQARKEGLAITTDMYTYTAGATGLDAAMPPWVQEGGDKEWIERLKDPAIRARVAEEMRSPTDAWENLMMGSGAEGTLLLGFRNPALRGYVGKTLAAVAKERGVTPEEAAMDLVIEDGSRVSVAYFMMSEENVKRQIALPWMSFGSDAQAMAAQGDFIQNGTHPRAYGNFARLLGKYVREENVIPMEEAIRKLTGLPAENLRLYRRGLLKAGYYADVVVFDPEKVSDRATFEKPHEYAAGVEHVWVNGRRVLKDGESTGTKSGRFVRGPGYKGAR